MASRSALIPDWTMPPGEILAESLDERGMSQAELARRMDRPLKTVNEIVKGKAAITGDFVLLGKEVNPVMKALRDDGIEVTAVHSHMLMEEPRLFFMHFWGNDDAAKLAKGVRAARDLTNSKKQ